MFFYEKTSHNMWFKFNQLCKVLFCFMNFIIVSSKFYAEVVGDL